MLKSSCSEKYAHVNGGLRGEETGDSGRACLRCLSAFSPLVRNHSRITVDFALMRCHCGEVCEAVQVIRRLTIVYGELRLSSLRILQGESVVLL
jgi:hypothetical protein